MTHATDEDHMRTALVHASTARRHVTPRPWVGSVVVAPDGSTFGGCTDGREGPHAEVVALRRAGERARGATIYATLEPCAHHGRTGPCAEAIIAAGIRRCVVGIADPDPLVAGQGIDLLRSAGVVIDVGVLAADVQAQLQPYLTHRETGRPYVVLKLAATLDGGTAAADGSSQWITGPAARQDAHGLRADSDAILVGAGTVRADDPSLTVRLPDGQADGIEPLRVVLGRAAPDRRVHPCLELQGELDGVLADLGRRGVVQLMVEGGAGVAQAFHQAGMVDRYVMYLAPALMGGVDGRGMFAGPGAPTIDDVWRGEIAEVRRVGDDLRIDLVPRTRRGTSPGYRDTTDTADSIDTVDTVGQSDPGAGAVRAGDVDEGNR